MSNSKNLIYGSLFSGIGGFDLGFDRAGMTCAWQVEKDKAAQSVLKKHWPNTPKYEDVRNVGKQNLESVDLICGGFPCQDVSVAGRRAGLAGERSGLWFEFRRIIAELRPQWVIIENVPGLLSSNKGRDMGAIVGALGKLGYWWAYRVLDAQYFGVPQRRRRMFIIGCLTKGCPQEVLFERESSPWDTPPSRKEGAELAAAAIRLAQTSSNGWGIKTDGTTSTLDQTGGDEVCSFSAGNSGGSYGVAYSENVTPPLRAGNSGTNQTPTICFVQNSRDEVRLMNGDGQRLDIESETFVTGPLANASGRRGWKVNAEDAASGKNLTTCGGVRRLTPIECERLQGFPDNHTAGQSDSARYRQLGNAVAVPVARWLGRRILDYLDG